MRYFILLFLCAVPMLGFAQTPQISKEDIRKTIEHMQQLARDSEAKADALLRENAELGTSLTQTVLSLRDAQIEKDAVQKRVNEVTEWGNKASAESLYWHEKQKEAVAKLWWWRLWGIAAIVLVVGGIIVVVLIKTGAGAVLPW